MAGKLQSFNRRRLLRLAQFLVNHDSGRRHTSAREYPQLWYYMPKRYHKVWTTPRRKAFIGYWLRPLLQWLCGILTSHEISKTEWGYGGGKFVDRNCRWCDKVIKVPCKEEMVPNLVLGRLADELGFNEFNP